MNDTAKSIVSIYSLGKQSGHMSRIMNNVIVAEHSEVPVLSGLYKDHKDGKKFRPLVNGNIGPISRLSELMSLILKSYMLELKERISSESTVKSTEELLDFIEEYNEKVKNSNSSEVEEKFVASMDVESLFPTRKTEDTVSVIKETVMESKIVSTLIKKPANTFPCH